MSRTDCDVFVSGGGIAGLAAAAALARRGMRVILADPAPPAENPVDASADLRSTAYLQPARRLFEHAGVWDALAPHATPLRRLRVVDTDGDPPRIRTERSFDPGDLDLAEFGWNVPNWRARAALTERLQGDDRVDLRLGAGFSARLARTSEVIVTLTDGTRIAARLALAADGRTSPLREAAGIGVRTTRYGQKALAFVVAHEAPHEDVSIEIYAPGGAFTLVPLPDHDGKPASAVVWMMDGPRAEATAKAADLGARATRRSAAILGPLEPLTRAAVFPVLTQTAERLVAERTALVAEAAHVLPPIGAQGLNASLADVAALARLADPADPGDWSVLEAYARDRDRDMRVRAAAIDVFNRVCRADAGPVRALRHAGLVAAHDIAPLRRALMRAGLGA